MSDKGIEVLETGRGRFRRANPQSSKPEASNNATGQERPAVRQKSQSRRTTKTILISSDNESEGDRRLQYQSADTESRPENTVKQYSGSTRLGKRDDVRYVLGRTPIKGRTKKLLDQGKAAMSIYGGDFAELKRKSQAGSSDSAKRQKLIPSDSKPPSAPLIDLTARGKMWQLMQEEKSSRLNSTYLVSESWTLPPSNEGNTPKAVGQVTSRRWPAGTVTPPQNPAEVMKIVDLVSPPAEPTRTSSREPIRWAIENTQHTQRPFNTHDGLASKKGMDLDFVRKPVAEPGGEDGKEDNVQHGFPARDGPGQCNKPFNDAAPGAESKEVEAGAALFDDTIGRSAAEESPKPTTPQEAQGTEDSRTLGEVKVPSAEAGAADDAVARSLSLFQRGTDQTNSARTPRSSTPDGQHPPAKVSAEKTGQLSGVLEEATSAIELPVSEPESDVDHDDEGLVVPALVLAANRERRHAVPRLPPDSDERSVAPEDVAEDMVELVDRVPLPVHDQEALQTILRDRLRAHLKELREDHEYITKNLLAKARNFRNRSKALLAPVLSTDKEIGLASGMIGVKHQCSPFRSMTDVQEKSQRKSEATESTIVVQLQTKTYAPPSAARLPKRIVSVPITHFGGVPRSAEVPNYTHYVSLRRNVLVYNQRQLHAWPHFGDDVPVDTYAEVREAFDDGITERMFQLLEVERALKYAPYVEAFLQECDCTMADVLRYLLASDIPEILKVQGRAKFIEEDTRKSERWVKVLLQLPPSTTERLLTVAAACAVFTAEEDFDLWHIARQSDYANLNMEEAGYRDAAIAYRTLACRVCHMHDCPYHGEMRERSASPVSDAEDDSRSENDDPNDIVYPPNVNFRKHVNISQHLASGDEVSDKHALNLMPGNGRSHAKAPHSEMRPPFQPCFHPGKSCLDPEANCRCARDEVHCEKSCGCGLDCERQFRGCLCSAAKPRKGKMVCFADSRCACFKENRECDPDLCGNCGADVVLDPENRYNEELEATQCHNVNIQRGKPRRTLLGTSAVHGFGLFAGEYIKENEFIGEYQGAILTKGEADRLGAVYAVQKLSYLFTLNKYQEVDGTSAGNKTRFINHQSGQKQNVQPKIMLCNTVHRIGMYASRNIQKGQELFFNYGTNYHRDMIANDPDSSAKTSHLTPHARIQAQVDEFEELPDEFQEYDNEDVSYLVVKPSRGKVKGKAAKGAKNTAKKSANLTAPKSSSNASAVKTTKPRGGARPGAGRKRKVPCLDEVVEMGVEMENVGGDDEDVAGTGAGAEADSDGEFVLDSQGAEQMSEDSDFAEEAVEEEEERSRGRGRPRGGRRARG